MDVVIAGGHGQIARRLARLLMARDDRVRGLIRNPSHESDLRADGSEPVVCDLEVAEPDALVGAIAGADALVFAAGAGSGSGAQRKLTIDRDGAIKLIAAAQAAGVRRYVIVSSVGAERRRMEMTPSASISAPRPRPTALSQRATWPGRSSDRAA